MAGKYDLEESTEKFARDVIRFCKVLPKNAINFELMSQVVRSAGSVGANYIEANEALRKKDFLHRIKICRKEAKETRYWLRLIGSDDVAIEKEASCLGKEATELMNIFGAILRKAS